MNKILSLAFWVFALFAAVQAQTFTVANADGVDIKYTVTTDTLVKVVSNNYQGRVVVPASVSYEGVDYTVTEVGIRAFAQCSDLTYVELPSTISVMGVQLFYQSGLDTLKLNCVECPVNPYGQALTTDIVKNFFGNTRFKNVFVVVPTGRLNYYRTGTAFSETPRLTSPSAVAVTMFVPTRAMLTVHNLHLKDYDTPAGYFTAYFEVGDKVWLAPYHNSHDTLFLGWDKGDVYLTEITGPDTLRPVYDSIGYGTLNVNNVITTVRLNGQMGYNNYVSNYFVPASSQASPHFSNGLWMAGIGESSYYVDACKFTPGDYVPGPLTVDGTCSSDLATRQAFNRVWSVSRAEIDDFIAHVGTEGYSIPENILSWPGNGGEGYASQLAPYYDADSNGIYEPRHGDYPLIKGDRMIFSIFNNHCVHYETGSYSMGYEIHMSAYAFDEPSLANTVFLSYKVINRSPNTYINSFFGAFTDFDIGYAHDDYVGCDVRAGMAYGYNGTDSDQNYSTVNNGIPPAHGSIILAGPYADPDAIDNPRVSIPLMQTFFPDSLARYLLADGSYDTAALNADADLYYPMAWNFTPNAFNAFINGANYGNGIIDDERMGMCRFTYYENSNNTVIGEPNNFNSYLDYIHGYWLDGSPVSYGLDGYNSDGDNLTCRFMFPGDSDPLHWGTDGIIPSINPDSWTENYLGRSPGDRRGLQITGPFTFLPGAEQTLDLAFCTSFGSTTALSSVDQLRSDALQLRRQFTHDTTDGGRAFTYRPYSAPIVGINSASQPSLQVYPNPATSEVTIALGDGQPVDIDLYDIRGQKVRSLHQAGGIVSINLSGLPQGIYILRCGSHATKIVKR